MIGNVYLWILVIAAALAHSYISWLWFSILSNLRLSKSFLIFAPIFNHYVKLTSVGFPAVVAGFYSIYVGISYAVFLFVSVYAGLAMLAPVYAVSIFVYKKLADKLQADNLWLLSLVPVIGSMIALDQMLKKLQTTTTNPSPSFNKPIKIASNTQPRPTTPVSQRQQPVRHPAQANLHKNNTGTIPAQTAAPGPTPQTQTQPQHRAANPAQKTPQNLHANNMHQSRTAPALSRTAPATAKPFQRTSFGATLTNKTSTPPWTNK